jgi:putative transposase
MSTQRTQYSAEFKARVALEALKGRKTVNELASTYEVHPTPIAHWNQRLQKERAEIFSVRRDRRERDHAALHAQLYQQIGQLQVEWDWVKKRRVFPPDEQRELIEPAHPQMSIARHTTLGRGRVPQISRCCGCWRSNLRPPRIMGGVGGPPGCGAQATP